MVQSQKERGNAMHISTKCSVAIHCLIFIFEYAQMHVVAGLDDLDGFVR